MSQRFRKSVSLTCSKLKSSVYSHLKDGTQFDRDTVVEQVLSPDGSDFICNQEAGESLCQKFGKSVYVESASVQRFTMTGSILTENWVFSRFCHQMALIIPYGCQ